MSSTIPGRTPQLTAWRADFGRAYTDRNLVTAEEMDLLWKKNFGFTRTQLNQRFLSSIPMDARILEVGCNIGNQLLLLQELGYKQLYGIETQNYALDLARTRTSSISFVQSSAFDLPFENEYFDLVFTSGVLIHISPPDLPGAQAEIHRCAKTYIWGAEYYAPTATEVSYRGHQGLLWKMDYARSYLRGFKDLELVIEQRLPYLDNENVDSMFLLRKVSGSA